MSTPPAAVGAVRTAPATTGGGWDDPWGLAVATVWVFTLGLGPIYTLRNRLEPLPVGQYIDDARINVVFVVIHVLAIGLLARRMPRLSPPTVVLLCALHVLVVASSLWSLAPGRSATQGALFALTTVAAVVVGDRIGIRGLLVAVAVASQVGVMLSLFAVRRDWPNAVDPNGDWAGIYLNRNSLGPVAVLALLATAAAVNVWAVDPEEPRRVTPRMFAIAVLGFALGLLDAVTLLGSASLTPLVGGGVAIASAVVAAGLPPLLRHRLGGDGSAPGGAPTAGMLATGVLTSWVGIAVVAMVGRSEVATNLDRSATLSGRTELWGWLIDASSRRPLSGWGWLGVWEDRALEVQVVDRFNVDFSTAHNAVIEMLLAAGVLGAILLVVTMGALIWPTMRLAVRRGPDHRIGVVAMGLVGYVVAVNQLETYVGANLLPWALLVAVAAACVRRLDEVDPTDRPEAATGPGAAT
ncbi:MAG: hypothetical protein R2704_05955 [Microthrixaceae bacterium]